ncbi:DUF4097 family beta strand repeat-containing protein [Caldicellulosiruptor naganoensis]|uniref:DUF4097 family beta strand repeat-containing protein n=1 Tax=Caldicellulosiruptor naganoensis TaxID=29324 RepID=A0ABY7BJ98_9FIRM|nr:DUF4097 family beta strand repeat-containing protein [Caldicellulosiruptor naganoensis]WAM31641.1 DUF4097 family beta strand repeat-containing protein [Caldicellulosiruptor naganoensis]
MNLRIFFVFVFVLILSLLSGCKHEESAVKEYSKEGRWEILNFKDKAFMLDSDNANIIIRGKKGTEHATIRYIKRIIWNIDDKITSAKAFSKSEIEKTFDDMQIKIERTVDRLYIKARAYSGEAILANTLSNPKKEFKFEIFLPENSKVFVQNSNGNISISNIQGGSIYIVNGKGNVTVTDAKASIEIKNGEGDIRLDYINGDFSINNGNGNINLKVKKAGVFKVIGTKGNITAKVDALLGFGLSSLVNLGEGDISFFVGKDVKARIKVNAKGRVKSDFSMIKTTSGHYIDLDSGKNSIEIINSKGTVRIIKDY